jgi:type I restriction enzyme S subunit
MKNGWKALPFEKCIEGVTYTKKIQRKEFLDEGAYPVISQEEAFINGYWNNEADLFRVTTPLVVFGDHTRVLKYVDFDFVLGADGVKLLRPREFLVPKFFFYQLQTAAVDSLGYARHYRLLKEVEITFPGRSEQSRIVGILDETLEDVATARANAEKNLRNARALFDSHLQSVFTQRGKGWAVKSISEVATHSLGKMLDKAKNKGELKPYLRNLNVRWFTFDLSDLREMRFLPEESSRCTAVKGDVLICEGGYPGRAAVWDEDYPIYFQKALHRVRFEEPDQGRWLLYYLYAQDRSGELKQHFSGAGIQHLTGEALARFELPLPPLVELRHALARFEDLYVETLRLEGIYQKKCSALETLKKSLLHQAFTGNL